MKLHIPTYLAPDMPNATLIESTTVTFTLPTGTLKVLELPPVPRIHLKVFIFNVTTLTIFRYGIVQRGTDIADLPNTIPIAAGALNPIQIWLANNETLMMKASSDITLRIEIMGETS